MGEPRFDFSRLTLHQSSEFCLTCGLHATVDGCNTKGAGWPTIRIANGETNAPGIGKDKPGIKGKAVFPRRCNVSANAVGIKIWILGQEGGFIHG